MEIDSFYTGSIIISLLCVSVSFVFGQNVSDTITFKKAKKGYDYYQGDRMISSNKFFDLLEQNSQSSEYIKSAQANSSMATALGALGGIMIGWPIGVAMGGGDPNWRFFAASVGLVAVSIPFKINSNKRVRQAVEIYNASLKANSFWDNNELKLGITGNGIGLVLNF